jgi:hypothetical protein
MSGNRFNARLHNFNKIFQAMKKSIAVCFGLLTTFGAYAQQPEPVDTAAIRKIKDEGLKQSKVMSTLSMLTDVYGPRLTNSPNHKKAAEYAKATLESYGLQNVQIDYWGDEFGRGWHHAFTDGQCGLSRIGRSRRI